MAGNTAVGRISIGSAAVLERQPRWISRLRGQQESGGAASSVHRRQRGPGAVRWQDPVCPAGRRVVVKRGGTSNGAPEDEGGELLNLFFPQFPVFLPRVWFSVWSHVRTRVVVSRPSRRSVAPIIEQFFPPAAYGTSRSSWRGGCLEEEAVLACLRRGAAAVAGVARGPAE